jgi:hypothetical protein
MSTQLSCKLSQHWHCIQDNLFPWLEETLGPLSLKHRQVVQALDMIRIEAFLPSRRYTLGRPSAERAAIARAFIAKAILNLPTTRQLIDRLKVDKVLRQLCGWECINDVPKEWSFSRAFAGFAKGALGEKAHEALIHAYQSERLVGHISRDATAIIGREKALKKPKATSTIKARRGRPKKGEVRVPKALTRLMQQLKMPSVSKMLRDLPKACDVGTKVDSKGYKHSWRGYKLHVDTADGEIPIACILTSASMHDSQAAIPLATITAGRVTSCYDVMDAAYDSEIIRNHSTSLGHVPLIDFNHRSKSDTRAFMPHEAERYKARSSAERTNARLKDDLGASFIRVKGHAKVMMHLMCGVLALTVEQLLRLVPT